MLAGFIHPANIQKPNFITPQSSTFVLSCSSSLPCLSRRICRPSRSSFGTIFPGSSSISGGSITFSPCKSDWSLLTGPDFGHACRILHAAFCSYLIVRSGVRSLALASAIRAASPLRRRTRVGVSSAALVSITQSFRSSLSSSCRSALRAKRAFRVGVSLAALGARARSAFRARRASRVCSIEGEKEVAGIAWRLVGKGRK